MADLRSLNWAKIDATEHLLAIYNTRVYDYLGGSPGNPITGSANKFPGSGSADGDAEWVEGHVVLGNGIDANCRYNGTNVRQQMVQAVEDAPSIVTNIGGSDTHPADTFEYRISFLNADGEYGEAGPIASVTVVQAFDSSVQDIPICPDGQDCSGRRIWRRSGGSTVFKLVADIADNTTTVYVDEVLNADLGEELIEGLTAFPPCAMFTEWKGRLVGSGNAADPQMIAVSNQEQHFYSPEAPDLDDPTQGTRQRLQGRAAGAVTGLKTHGGLVAVFTGGAGFLLQGNQPKNFSLQEFTHHGCVAHRTICSARDLLLWLANDGVYAWLGGGAVTRISDDVTVTLEALTASQLAAAHAVVFDDRYYLFWDAGALYFDLEYKQWGELTNNTWRTSTVSEFVSGGKARIWASLDGETKVYQLETGSTDAVPSSPTTITATWASKDFDMGLPGREKRVTLVETKFRKSTGTATVTLYRGTGESIQSLSHNTADVTESSSETVSRKRQSAVETARSEHFRLKVEIASTATDVELLAAGLLYTIAD